MVYSSTLYSACTVLIRVWDEASLLEGAGLFISQPTVTFLPTGCPMVKELTFLNLVSVGVGLATWLTPPLKHPCISHQQVRTSQTRIQVMPSLSLSLSASDSTAHCQSI